MTIDYANVWQNILTINFLSADRCSEKFIS